MTPLEKVRETAFSEELGRALREKWRGFGDARRALDRYCGYIENFRDCKSPGSVRDAGGQRLQRIAKLATGALVLLSRVDQRAMVVDVLERMDQRRLPREEQGGSQENSCERPDHSREY